MGLLSTKSRPWRRLGGDPRVQQAGRQGAVGEHQDSVQSWGWWAGQLHRLSSSPGTSLWEWDREGEEGHLSLYPAIFQFSSKHPLTRCPMGPSSPSWGQDNRAGVRVSWQWGFWLLALDP